MIKKVFGILCLVISLVAAFICALNVGGIRINIKDDDYAAALIAGINEHKPETYAWAVTGLFFFVMGVLMATRRTSSQRRMEYEYEALKQHYEENVIEDVTVQIEKLARLKQQGLLTEEEFQVQKGRVLK